MIDQAHRQDADATSPTVTAQEQGLIVQDYQARLRGYTAGSKTAKGGSRRPWRDQSLQNRDGDIAIHLTPMRLVRSVVTPVPKNFQLPKVSCPVRPAGRGINNLRSPILAIGRLYSSEPPQNPAKFGFLAR